MIFCFIKVFTVYGRTLTYVDDFASLSNKVLFQYQLNGVCVSWVKPCNRCVAVLTTLGQAWRADVCTMKARFHHLGVSGTCEAADAMVQLAKKFSRLKLSNSLVLLTHGVENGMALYTPGTKHFFLFSISTN